MHADKVLDARIMHRAGFLSAFSYRGGRWLSPVSDIQDLQ